MSLYEPEYLTDYEQSNPDDEFRNEVVRLLRVEDAKAAHKYEYCHREGHGWVKYCSEHPDHDQVFIPCSCSLRICNMCSPYLAGKMRVRYKPLIEAVAAKRRRGYKLKLVTLTRSIELSEDIGGDVLATLDAAHKLYKKLWGKDKHSGAIATLEAGEVGHKIHVHMIVYGKFVWKSKASELAYLQSRGLDEKSLSGGLYLDEVWQELTGDYIVDIENVPAYRAVYEGLKYITKFSNLSPAQLVALHIALKGRRRVRSWGCFYGVSQEIEDDYEQVCRVCGAAFKTTTETGFIDVMLNHENECAHGENLDLTRANKSPPNKQLKMPFLEQIQPNYN